MVTRFLVAGAVVFHLVLSMGCQQDSHDTVVTLTGSAVGQESEILDRRTGLILPVGTASGLTQF